MEPIVQDVASSVIQNNIPTSPSAYVFCVIALLIQPVIVWYVYHKQDKDKASLRVPMVAYSFAYIVIQFFVFWKYLRWFTGDRQPFAYIIQLGILIAFTALEIALLSSNRYAERVENERKESTDAFVRIRQMMEIEITKNTDPERKSMLNAISEQMRYESPVSNENVVEENQRLMTLIENISETSGEEFEQRCEEIRQVIQQRKIKMLNQ